MKIDEIVIPLKIPIGTNSQHQKCVCIQSLCHEFSLIFTYQTAMNAIYLDALHYSASNAKNFTQKCRKID